jgi:hypothetical protein
MPGAPDLFVVLGVAFELTFFSEGGSSSAAIPWLAVSRPVGRAIVFLDLAIFNLESYPLCVQRRG